MTATAKYSRMKTALEGEGPGEPSREAARREPRPPMCMVAMLLAAILIGCNRETEKPQPTTEPAGATGGHYMATTGPGAAMPVVPPAPKPTGALPKGASCVTPECHAIMARAPQIHGPVAQKACDACHDEDTGLHFYPLKRDPVRTCTFCHGVSGTQEHQHKALEQGCMVCHNPHTSRAKFLLKADTIERTCTSCHNLPMKRFAHEPFLRGQCTLCHQPHEADNKRLLRGGEGAKHCLSCHDNLRLGMSQSSHVHEPAAKDCTTCHDPHTSENPRELRQPLEKMCASCHKNIEQKAASAAVSHGAMTQDKKCANCHNVHASNQGALLHDRMDKVCLTCHDREIKGKDGRTVVAMKVPLTGSKFLHGQIRAGSCSGCHDPHGAGHANLLERTFPESFYTRFEVGKYDLCFTCHQADMVLAAKTTTLTGFRDGDRNMHFLHVNRDDKGRSCKTCHAIHGSNLPRHMASDVPFENSKWTMPIGFSMSDDGGRCAPGCHVPKTYSRAGRPGGAPTTVPTTRGAP